MTKWEYLRFEGWSRFTDESDQLGLEGWELVSFTYDGTFIFKRPVYDRL